jgi:NADH dehydrogenase
MVEPDLSVPGHPHIFVIGDAALMLGANGKPMSGDAGVAKQHGKYAAKLLIARSKSKTFPPFRYRDLGSIAAIGHKSAIVQMHRLKLTGVPGREPINLRGGRLARVRYAPMATKL